MVGLADGLNARRVNGIVRPRSGSVFQVVGVQNPTNYGFDSCRSVSRLLPFASGALWSILTVMGKCFLELKSATNYLLGQGTAEY